MVELSAVVLGVGVVLVFIGIANLMRLDHALAGRLRHYAVGEAVLQDSATAAPRTAMAGTVTSQVDKAIRGRSFVARLQADLARADLKVTAAEFLIGQAALSFSMMLVGYNLVALVARPNLLALPVFGLIGYFLPKIWVMRRASARLRAFNNQLPDTITLMANALRSGMSLLQAMDMVAREAGPPIAEEFSRVGREVGLGLSPEDALRHLQQRIRSDDVALLVTAINVQHEVGGNLAELLDGIADTIRERVQLKGEVRTITTQQRASGYILGVMPIVAAVLLMLVSPSYMGSLFVLPYIVLPILAALSVVVGLFVIRGIVNSVEI
jgi:tight adherence protein B